MAAELRERHPIIVSSQSHRLVMALNGPLVLALKSLLRENCVAVSGLHSMQDFQPIWSTQRLSASGKGSYTRPISYAHMNLRVFDGKATLQGQTWPASMVAPPYPSRLGNRCVQPALLVTRCSLSSYRARYSNAKYADGHLLSAKGNFKRIFACPSWMPRHDATRLRDWTIEVTLSLVSEESIPARLGGQRGKVHFAPLTPIRPAGSA